MAHLLAPSILSADFANLGAEVSAMQLAGADWIHVDVMDGHFVPNLTIGPQVVQAIRKHTSLPLDVHLMVTNPENLIPAFAASGADIITIHYEATDNLAPALTDIRRLGKKAGLSLRPSTPIAAIANSLELIDLLLVMSVNPGFSGQTFMPEALPRLKDANDMITAKNVSTILEVDGGINPENAKTCVATGAKVLVAGTAAFKNGKDFYKANLEALR